MANANYLILMGNLTRDPELRYLPTGQALCNFSLAINRSFKTAAGEKKERTDFIPIEIWGKQAESCKQYLAKGRGVFVEGRLQQDSWESDDGTKRSRLKVVANRVQFLPRTGSAVTEGPSVEGESLPETEQTEGGSSSSGADEEPTPF